MKKPNIQLFNQSCFDYLPTIPNNSVNLICIDPPYEISKEPGARLSGGIESLRVSMDFGEWDHDFVGLDIVVKQCYRILKPGGTFICFYDLWKLTTLDTYVSQAGFSAHRFIEYVKTNPVPINSKINYLTNAREIAITAVKGGNNTFHSEYDNGIYYYPINHEPDRFHPTQKPLDLIKALICKHSDPEDLVLDCFSGSGTTAVACIDTNRNFVGCELSKDYFDKSMERINRKLKNRPFKLL